MQTSLVSQQWKWQVAIFKTKLSLNIREAVICNQNSSMLSHVSYGLP